mgnify:CR=1 FL=1
MIVTSGAGHIDQVHVDSEFKLKLRNTIKGIHSDMVREIAVNKAQISQFASGGPQTIPAFQPEISGFRFRQKANDRRSGFQSHRHAVNHSRWSHWLCQMARLQSECALIFLFPLDCYLFCRCVRELHAGRWSLHDFRHSSKDDNSCFHRQHGKAGLTC